MSTTTKLFIRSSCLSSPLGFRRDEPSWKVHKRSFQVGDDIPGLGGDARILDIFQHRGVIRDGHIFTDESLADDRREHVEKLFSQIRERLLAEGMGISNYAGISRMFTAPGAALYTLEDSMQDLEKGLVGVFGIYWHHDSPLMPEPFREQGSALYDIVFFDLSDRFKDLKGLRYDLVLRFVLEEAERLGITRLVGDVYIGEFYNTRAIAAHTARGWGFQDHIFDAEIELSGGEKRKVQKQVVTMDVNEVLAKLRSAGAGGSKTALSSR